MTVERDTPPKKPRQASASARTAPEARSEASLSRDRIVATAVDLLDTQGRDGLTMRRLADRLNSGVMSLYWHVDNKDDVLDLALNSVLEYRAPTRLAEPGDWRAELIHMLEDWRASMLRHPWSASLLPHRALGPNMLCRLERLGETLSRAGVADEEVNVAIWSLWNYVMGATITRANFDRSDDDKATAQQRLAEFGSQYPTIERSRLLLDNDWDGTFRKGLDVLFTAFAPDDTRSRRHEDPQ